MIYFVGKRISVNEFDKATKTRPISLTLQSPSPGKKLNAKSLFLLLRQFVHTMTTSPSLKSILLSHIFTCIAALTQSP